MNLYTIRNQLLEGKTLNEMNLKVVFYARVSTEKDVQLNSLDNQITFFKDYIKSKNNWQYIRGYIDEGLSGSSVKKRKNFQAMINDAKNNKFDLIITKEVSRFSRNLADSIKYTQELLKYNVGVYFYSNGINTFDPNSEFILNMMGSVAQEEVKRLSERIKWGNKEAMKKGHILGSGLTGYIKENKKLIINPNEKEKIIKIYEMYATNKYSLTTLATILHEQGINNKNNNKYSKDSLKKIIENPKYKGYYRAHTTEVINYQTKKRIKIPKENQIIYKSNTIPAIVTEELWDQANKILNDRKNKIKENKGNAKLIVKKYPYTGKIYCSSDLKPYQRISNNKRNLSPKWACTNYVRENTKKCLSPIIKEEDLDNIFLNIMKNILPTEFIIIKELLNYYKNIKENIYSNSINILKNNIKQITQKKEKILDLTITNNLSNKEFKERNDLLNKELEKNKQDLNNILNKKSHIINNNKKESNLKELLYNEINYNNNINDFINTFLIKIIVYKINKERNNLLLKIYLKRNNIINKLIYKTNINSIDNNSRIKNKFKIEVYLTNH